MRGLRQAGDPILCKPDLRRDIPDSLPPLDCVLHYIETMAEKAIICTVFYKDYTRSYYQPILTSIPHKRRQIRLTRIFYRDILPRIVHDQARDLFYEFYHPVRGEQEGLDEFAKVSTYLKEKREELLERRKG